MGVIELTAANVEEVTKYCLFSKEEMESSKEELYSRTSFVKGITIHFGFNKARIDEKFEDIKTLLRQLPEEFYASKGGGMSFLRACMRFDGEQWGEHKDVQNLLCLGQATTPKLVTQLTPEFMNASIPGGVPYFRLEF